MERGESPKRYSKKHVPLEMQTKMTKRKAAKIFDIVRVKLGEQLFVKMGNELTPEMREALHKPEVQAMIQQKIGSKDIKFVDSEKQTLYGKQMQRVANDNDSSFNETSPHREGESFHQEDLSQA